MLTSLAFLQQVNLKKIGKLAEKAKIEENLHILWQLDNFNEIFKRNVTRDHIKSHEKSGLHPL